ncbi:hypothetical protein EJP02_229 [Escherichia phage EJP2]|nr:hypothetical protein EJP02_229 [Escherichia phage EJP2]
MKVEYYYDGQFRRVLKHLIRVFGDFKVLHSIDDAGLPVYRGVPCRYADISRLAAYIISGGSENTVPTAPMMTISVQSLKMERNSIRSPVAEQVIMGTNKSPAQNEYTKELDEQYLITRYNPVPWTFVFDLNIWTTTLTNKMELFEQITTLFSPSITLQLSENPLDWTSATDVELIDCQFSSRAMPQGTDTDMDIMTLSFKSTVWFSLPGTVEKPKLISQIVTNVHNAKDELDIELTNWSEPIVDVFTPKNMCILVDEITQPGASTSKYELTLVNSSLNKLSANNKIFSWPIYLKYLEPSFDKKEMFIKFQRGIEDTSAIKGTVLSIGSDDTANKIIVEVDNSLMKRQLAIVAFVTESQELNGAIPEQYYVNISERDIFYKDNRIPPEYIVRITSQGIELIPPASITDYVYNSSDSGMYKYTTKFGWHKAIMNKYRQGYWRIGFRNT